MASVFLSPMQARAVLGSGRRGGPRRRGLRTVHCQRPRAMVNAGGVCGTSTGPMWFARMLAGKSRILSIGRLCHKLPGVDIGMLELIGTRGHISDPLPKA